jgi:hypothetical protein
MPMNEDMAVFFNSSEFATEGLLDGVAVDGIFESGSYYEPASLIAGSRTTFLVPSAATASTTTSSTLVINAATYRVRSIEPDGTGLTLLDLETQP